MIPNGYWMMDQIPEEWQDKVRFSAFPENKMVSSPETFGWAIVSGYSEEIKEGQRLSLSCAHSLIWSSVKSSFQKIRRK